MHFPTSLPRSTGSPAAKLSTGPPNITIQSVHSDPYDGPQPVLPRNRPRPLVYAAPRYKRRTSSKQLSIATQPTPVYSYIPQLVPGSNAPKDQETAAPVGSSTIRRALKSTGQSSITSPPTSGSNNSIPNIDGTIRLFHNVPTKTRSKLTGLFGKKPGRPEDDSEDSPTEAAEFYELKKKKSEKAEAEARAKAEIEAGSGGKSANSSRSRLAARLLRHRGKTGAIETGLDLDDADHHPFDGARQRLNDQRERKMRRKIMGSKLSDPPRGEPPSGDRRRQLSGPLKRGVHFASEKLEVYQASKEEDKAQLDAGMEDGSRISNSLRRMSAHLSPAPEEAEAGARRASWASAPSRRDSTPLYPGTSSSDSPDEIYIPRAADIPDIPIPPVPLFLQQPSQDLMGVENGQLQDPAMPAYGGAPISPRSNPYMFPPKPPVPFFRPTLSPVSSRSPAPTSVHAVTSSPKRSSDYRRKSRPQSVSPRMQPPEHSASVSSVHLPLPEVVLPPTPPSQKPSGLAIRNGAPTILTQVSAVSPRESVVLSPIIEQTTPEQASSNISSRKSKQPSPPEGVTSPEEVSSLDLDHGQKKPQRPALGNEEFPSSSPDPRSLASPPQFSEINRPRTPPPHPSPSPLKIAPRTPTASALEFWREADESLAPSESASAQPPNPRGEPPPPFWKAADKALDMSHDKGPSMEEWIASLPGLGLGLGSWGNADGALDWKYFQTLKKGRKLQKRRSASSVVSAKSAKEMILEDMERLEKVIENLEVPREKAEATGGGEGDGSDGGGKEEGLTPDQVEALDDDEPRSPVVDNLPPTPVDLSLLHPQYRAPTPLQQRPQSRLGRDVAGRLEAMEKYWAEQSVAMGSVLKRMLVVVDGLIVKEREQAQREMRGIEMGWGESAVEVS